MNNFFIFMWQCVQINEASNRKTDLEFRGPNLPSPCWWGGGVVK